MTKTRRIEITIETHEITRTQRRSHSVIGEPAGQKDIDAINEICRLTGIDGLPEIGLNDLLESESEMK